MRIAIAVIWLLAVANTSSPDSCHGLVGRSTSGVVTDAPKSDFITKQRLREVLKGCTEHEGIYWSNQDMDAMVKIAWKESRLNPKAQNETSSAYGLWQFLDSTWENYGVQKTHEPIIQTLGAVRYVKSRYGTPLRALAFHERKGWY